MKRYDERRLSYFILTEFLFPYIQIWRHRYARKIWLLQVVPAFIVALVVLFIMKKKYDIFPDRELRVTCRCSSFIKLFPVCSDHICGTRAKDPAVSLQLHCGGYKTISNVLYPRILHRPSVLPLSGGYQGKTQIRY